jgi:molybdate transport system ATP-binding protein
VLVRLDVPQLAGQEAGSVISGEFSGYDPDYDLTHIRFSGGELRVPGRHGEPNATLRLRIRANDISLCRERPRESTILNILHGTIDAIETATAATCLVRLKVGDEKLLARITRRSADDLGLQPGQSIEVQIKAAAVRGP